MIEEQPTTLEENPKAAQPTVLDTHPDEIEHPDLSGFFSVLIQPDDSITITFSISPKGETKAIGSITTGFFRNQGGVLLDSFGGTNLCVTPALTGQKISGGTSEKLSAFCQLPPGEIYEAVLQGTLKKDGESAGSFFITKVVELHQSNCL